MFVFIYVLVIVLGPQSAKKVSATVASNETDAMNRQKISTAASHDISFTMGGGVTLATGETIIIDFHEDDSGFTMPATVVANDIDMTTVKSSSTTEAVIFSVTYGSPDCSGSSGANDVAVGIVDATGIMTFQTCSSWSATDAASVIDIEIGSSATQGATGTDRIVNPASAGSSEIDFSGTWGDDAFPIDVPIMDDDQVSVTASVNTTITFDIDVSDGHGDSNAPYTMSLGELSALAVTDETDSGISEIYVDLTTNADNGAVVQVKNANGGSGLTSSSTSDNIPSSDTNLTTSSADGGYGIAGDERAAATTGTLTEVAPFNEPGTNPGGVGGLTTSFQTIFNTGSAPIVNGDGVIYVRAVAGTSTSAAADYTDTLTFRATATY